MAGITRYVSRTVRLQPVTWLTSEAKQAFDESLLIRDTLYLLQGIDGRYVRFAVRPAAEADPGPSQPASDGDAGEEIVGIDIVADETKVGFTSCNLADPQDGYISMPTRSVIAQISELGVMYRKITAFVQSRPPGVSKGGMTEQVCLRLSAC